MSERMYDLLIKNLKKYLLRNLIKQKDIYKNVNAIITSFKRDVSKEFIKTDWIPYITYSYESYNENFFNPEKWLDCLEDGPGGPYFTFDLPTEFAFWCAYFSALNYVRINREKNLEKNGEKNRKMSQAANEAIQNMPFPSEIQILIDVYKNATFVHIL